MKRSRVRKGRGRKSRMRKNRVNKETNVHNKRFQRSNV